MSLYKRTAQLIGYRDLDAQAKNVLDTAKKEERAKLLASMEKQDVRAGKSEANFKNFSNVLIMSATFAFGLAAALFGAPLWALLLGLGLFSLSFAYQSIGLTIETNRNQSQSDTITRTLYKQKQKGLNIGEIDKDALKKNNKQNIINKIDNAVSVSDPNQSKELLEKAIRKDKRNTRREQLFKVLYFGLYIGALAIITAGAPYFMMSTTAVLATSGTLFGLAFVADGIGARLESIRNANQNSGLRRISLSNMDLEKKNAELSKTVASKVETSKVLVGSEKKIGNNDNIKGEFTERLAKSREVEASKQVSR